MPDFTNNEIILVTGNPGKLHELTALAPPALHIVSQKLDLDEIQSLDVQEIIEHKLHEAFDKIGKPVIVEDVSAGLDSLNGLPGPFIKFFEQRLGRDALYQIQRTEHDKVTIHCVAGFYDGRRMLFGNGIITGRIVAPRGDNGFGFDWVIVPDEQPGGNRRTFAEMTTDEKNSISHRGRAFRDLIRQLTADLAEN
jgi:non-canonical purine NTP pyrophosphatase (RdgB/HAM1 family)